MKLVAPLAYLAAAHADLISYKLQDAAPEMAALFISDGNFASQLFNHGCWCAKLANQAGNNLGGNQPVDDLDQICKDWARARRCSRSAGSACENADFTSTYEIQFNNAHQDSSYQSCANADSCSSESCQIDYYYIQAINDWKANNVFNFNSNPVCIPHASTQINNCQDWPTTPAPSTPQCVVEKDYIGCNGNDLIRFFDNTDAAGCQDACLADANCDLWVYVGDWQRCHLKNYSNNGGICYHPSTDPSIVPSLVAGFEYECVVPVELADTLGDVGVDNSNKQVAVSLLWEHECDLDLHVFEPNGEEIFYDNLSSANTGSLDADSWGAGASGYAVENISWLTAPTGTFRVAVKNYDSCTGNLPYQIHVQTGNNIETYDFVAPSGDNSKIEVLTFDWSNTQRSQSVLSVNFTEKILADDNAPAKNKN